MARKLPVFKTVGEAFRTAFFPPVFGTWFFFGYLLLIVLWREVVSVIDGFFGTLGHPVVQQIWAVTGIPLIAPFAVSIHRHIILGDATPKPRKLFGSFFSKRNMAFAWYMFVIASPLFLLQLLSQLPRIGFPLGLSLFGFVQIPYAILLAGFIICLPFIAIDNKQTFARCWEKTKGNILRVFFVTAITGAVLTIVALIIIRPLQNLSLGDGFTGQVTWIGILIIDVIGSVFFLIWAAVGVAAVSHIFVFLSAEPKVTDDEAKSLKIYYRRLESAQEWEREWIKKVESNNKHGKKDTKKPG